MTARIAAAIVSLAALVETAAPARAIETTDTLPGGRADLEVKGRYARNPSDAALRLASTISIGLAPGLQASVGSRLLRIDPDDGSPHSGFGDTFVDAKYRAIDEHAMWPALAVVPAVRFPTGRPAQGLGAPGYDAGVLVAVSKSAGPVTVTGNAGWTFLTAEEENASDAWTIVVGVNYAINSAWALSAESTNTIGTRNADTAVLRAGST